MLNLTLVRVDKDIQRIETGEGHILCFVLRLSNNKWRLYDEKGRAPLSDEVFSTPSEAKAKLLLAIEQNNVIDAIKRTFENDRQS